MLVLVDVCVVVPVIELDVDACDDNFVDWGGAPGVTVVVLVAKHPVIKDRTTLPRRVQSTTVFIFFYSSLFIYF